MQEYLYQNQPQEVFAFPRPQTINIFAYFELRYHLIYGYKDRYEAKKNSGVVGIRCGCTFSDNIADIQTIFLDDCLVI